MTKKGSRPRGDNVIAMSPRRGPAALAPQPVRPDCDARGFAGGSAGQVASGPWPVTVARPGRSSAPRGRGSTGRDGESMLTVLVDLEHSYPPVWRRLELASSLRLDQLHDIIIGAMGWQDIHLHAFRSAFRGEHGVVLPVLLTDADLDNLAELEPETSARSARGPVRPGAEGGYARGGRSPLARSEPGPGGERGVHESAILVGEVLADGGDVLHHAYDMTSGWRHVLTVESVRPRREGEPRAVLTGGERACPPEDCGGAWIYNDIVALLTGTSGATLRLQTHPDDVLDQIDWLPEGFDPAAFDVREAAARVEAIDLLELPPPLPPLDSLDPALHELIASCDTAGRRAAAHLLAHAGIDAPSLVAAHAARTRRAVAEAGAAVMACSGPGGVLPPELDEAACAAMVAPFGELLALVAEAGADGVPADGNGSPPRRLAAAAIALRLLRCRKGRLRLPVASARAGGEPGAPARELATAIARALPLGSAPQEVDAGVLSLLSAAAGLTRCDLADLADPAGSQVGAAAAGRVANLCRTVLDDAGWRTRAGRVSRPVIAFWADQTWSVLSLLSGGPGVADPGTCRCCSAAEFPSGVPAPVRLLARSALRMW